jgi:cell division protein FtsB
MDGAVTDAAVEGRGWPRLLRPVLATVIALGVLLVGIFPTRAIIEQRAELAGAERSLDQVEERNEELADRAEALATDAEIERIAREQYNLGRPGEEVYAILPAPPAPPDVPDAWPFRGLHEALQATGAATP